MGVYELLWGIGAAALLLALAWGAARYRRSSRADDEDAGEAAPMPDTDPENNDGTRAPRS